MAKKKFPTGDIRALSEEELLAIIARGSQPGPGFWDTLSDVGKSGAVGVGEAGIGIAGLPGDVELLARMGAEKIAGGPSNIIPPQQLPTSGAVRQAVEGWTGPFYEPKTPAGKVARSVGEQAPGVLFPGGPVRKAVNVLAPAFGAEAAEKVAGESSTARLVGTLAGGMAGARGITPAPASPERARLGAVLQAEGVPLTAGQRTGNRPLMWFEQAAADTPFAAGRAADLNTTQKEAFTRGALRRVGEDARRVTPEVMDRALTRMGTEFDRLAAIHAMPLDSALMQDLAQIGRRYAMEVTPDKQARVIEATIADITGLAAQSPAVGGQVYANLRSQLDRIARRTQDGELRATIQEIRHAMDDAIERGMQITGRTQDLDAWRQVRRQYRNFIPIEKAATGAGSETAEGLLSPSQLRTAVVSEHGRRNYARGQGDLAEYARAAEALMKPLPQSGTAPRQAAGNLFASMAGGLVGHTATGDVSGTLAGMMLPAAAGRAALSGPMQAYLGNQLLPMTRAEMYRRLLAQQLLARPEEERLGVAPHIAPPPLLGVADRREPRLGVSR